ncbi:MAG TPA: hypothetical protein EYP60_04750 [bacterium (Candidatus Stahlbacteria)]|nr:hypothetical protein [Candidatus Stahlbacteria bacterium]
MSIPSVLAKEKKSTTLQTWDYFIATDFDSILDRTGHLRPLGVIAVNPQQFIEDNFLTLEELIRTVHGFVPSRHFAQIPSGNFRYARVVSCNWWAHTDMG